MSIKGYSWSDEARARLKESYQVPERNPFFGRKHTEESKRKMSLSMTGKKHNAFSPETKLKMKAYHLRPEIKQSQSERLKKQWQDETFRDKCAIKNMAILRRVASLGATKTCNSGEEYLLNILNELFPSEYKYNDGWFMLGRKFPDFVNVNGQKKVIELFGEKWHPIFDIARKQEHYKQFGYDVLIIWGNQLKSKSKLINILKRFHER